MNMINIFNNIDAETNINTCNEDIYKIPKYNSKYNSLIKNNCKGTVVAFYIDDMFT